MKLDRKRGAFRFINRKSGVRPVAMAVASLFVTMYANAAEIDLGNEDLKVRWDNTVKYSAAWRTQNPSGALVGRSNYDDGDRNFGRGLISNRVDLLSELDVMYKDVGARISGAAWYDSVYTSRNDNNSPSTVNSVSSSGNSFTQATRDLHGQKAELLDAFVFGKANIGETQESFRLGRHALIWGESLFFGANGIAGGMAPIDVVKAQSVPSTQFKELIRPVGQASGQIQLNPNVTVAGFYQYRWEKTRLPASGSYFSTGDILDAGGERILTGPSNAGTAFFRGADINARNSGQGGLSLKYTPEGSGIDLGFYATRYHAKTPTVYLRPGGFNPLTGQIGTYSLVYAEGIQAYGISASTTISSLNLAGEISVRRNTPLVSPPLVAAATADNNSNAAYAVGNSAHAQVSGIYTLSPNFIANESTLVGEVAWNRRTSITKNAAALDPGATRDAWGMRMTYEPFYRQVAPGLDVSIPFGIGYFPKGRSSVVSSFGPDKGGDLSIGINGTYQDMWRFGLNYTHFFGSQDTALYPDPNNPSANLNSFKQSLRDRDFISFTARATF
ncbi:DUF1302 domain-containing protein [Herbaspirillum lusitanum]|uniref:DUF1302 domain-containing protein n=1 Tax=Herbaspirillum lusitanum TaxID=213312 RepID=UPI0012F48B12|nr:DUF1302 domain-containing protein [Herbaspirillum lusitanum]